MTFSTEITTNFIGELQKFLDQYQTKQTQIIDFIKKIIYIRNLGDAEPYSEIENILQQRKYSRLIVLNSKEEKEN